MDDSGSGGDSVWFVLAGYVASLEAWDAFEPEWRAAINTKPSIEYFHAHEAESRKGQFLGFTLEERNSKIDSLIQTIQNHARQAISVRVRQANYDAVIKGNVPPELDNAYYFMFPAFVQTVIALERHMGRGEEISLVFDSSERFEKRSKGQYERLKDHQLFANCVVNIDYKKDTEHVQLQAADLLAWQVRRAFSVKNEPRRPQLDGSRKCAWPFFDTVVTRNDLQRGMAAMEKHARRYAATMGIPVEVIQSWKKK